MKSQLVNHTQNWNTLGVGLINKAASKNYEHVFEY